jgi:hypothetical protein
LSGCADEWTLEQRCDPSTSAYSDVVLRYQPTIAGGPFPGHPNFGDPSEALGSPNYTGGGEGQGAVSLSMAGVLELGFEQCVGRSTGDEGADLQIHEVGPMLESFHLFISTPDPAGLDPALSTGDGYYYAGLVTHQQGRVDIDGALGLSAPITIDGVRLIDDPATGTHGDTAPGADIDAVELLWPTAPLP